ncbi:MAG: Twitching motility protein PilT [Verrucomicrobiales bacterium]|nr:Twitching motility protein PilT [Verrucomicrobiales bacterium]
MTLDALIASARENGASDLHLEAGLPAALRVRGSLRISGDPIPAKTILDAARELIGAEQWPVFLERRSFDLSKNIQGVRCRINVLQSSRGVGMAIRLLASFDATIETLNLNLDIKRFVLPNNGLVLISGATGSGKSSTLAALIQEINLTEARHIVTIESPIEYTFRPRRAYIRQREVGRDTPSFEQALLDSLREDPDVLMVGEMRDPETMRLTLNAAETGHLVLATVHSSNCAEALQRVVSAFPSDIQNSVAAQLADCLLGVVAQRLHFRPDLNIRVPECEILTSAFSIKNFIRNRDFFKIQSSMETGAEHGMWTFARYRTWLEKKTNFHIPGKGIALPDDDTAVSPQVLPPMVNNAATSPKKAVNPEATQTSSSHPSASRIEIEPMEDFDQILKKPQK